eukprot:1156161-Prymnesium_polylepis.1
MDPRPEFCHNWQCTKNRALPSVSLSALSVVSRRSHTDCSVSRRQRILYLAIDRKRDRLRRVPLTRAAPVTP